MKRVISIAWMVLVGGAAACSDANVAGNYTAQITNGADGCSLGLTKDQNLTADFIVTQDGSDVSLRIEGFSGGFISLLAGSAVLTGNVDGDDVDVERIGTVKKTEMSCEYMVNVQIKASQDGDSMSGRVEYRAATNADPTCGSRQNCISVQEFNATRPPRSSGSAE
jgi:hypothetical protein